jgi:PAS domain S-box-containing protein
VRGEDGLGHSKRIGVELGALFKGARVPIIVLYPDGTFAAANDIAIGQYGYSLEELLARRIHDLIVDARDVDADLERVGRSEDMTFERRRHRRKDGTTLWVVPAATTMIVCGEPYIVSVLQDVTALFEAETHARRAALSSLRDRQLVLNAIAAMLGEREVKPAEDVLARSVSTAIGGSASVWLPETPSSRRLRVVASHRWAAPAELPSVLELDREPTALRAWETGMGSSVSADQATSGTLESAAIGWARDVADASCIVVPLLGRRGAYGLVYAVRAASDDTDRALAMATMLANFGGLVLETVQLEARAERDEQRAEDLWHAASERLTDGIALIDRDYRVMRINSAMRALVQSEAADIVGKKCSEVFQVCQAETPCPHALAAASSQRVVREFRGRVSGRPLRIEIVPMSPGSTDFAFIHLGHDQTEERATRSGLISADRLATIGRLAAGVAHEVNNPAALVTVNLGVLRDRFATGAARTAEVLAMLDESLEGMDRIRDIVRDLKGFARERSRERVDLGELVASAVRMAAHATRGHARVAKSLQDDVWATVRGARIAQVLLNLIINAAQAIPPGQAADHRILVRTFKEGDYACIEVSDTGPGVPRELAERIFEPFFTTRESSGGTGLGLWLAREIVKEEGGNIVLRERSARGACFLLSLMASPARPGRTETSTGVQAPMPELSKMKDGTEEVR